MGSSPAGKMEGPYSARLPSSSIGEKSRRAPAGRRTADDRAHRPESVAPPSDGVMTGEGSRPTFAHEPVMKTEVLEAFAPVPAGTLVDATLGGGGHADAILRSRGDLRVVGIDQDPAALAAATARLSIHGVRVQVARGRFDRLDAILTDLGIDDVVGVLFDLGVSSPQFDLPERGFSYRADGPLDMRMNPDQTLSADILVNHTDGRELASILLRYSDERFATRIAEAIVAARPVTGTSQLADIVRDAIPAAARRRGGHPAKRTFQALRIAVNEELGVLEPALRQAIDRLRPEGRGAVLSYHSGEDRIVKAVLRDVEATRIAPPGLPVESDLDGDVRLIRRGGQVPADSEISRNPRAGSARLRVFEKLDVAS